MVKLDDPRQVAVTTTTASCFIPTEYLTGEYEDIPDEDRHVIEEQNGLPCDGGGVPGSWCERCAWGKVESEEEL